MNCTRRHFVQTSAAAIAASFCPAVTLAETAYPSRPVRLVLGFPVGGLSDIAARLLAPRLGERLGQPVIVDNKPGAVTNIATDWVLRSQADGYTVLMATVLNAINASVYDKLPFNFIRDATPIASILDAAFVLEVHPSVPAKDARELVALAKAKPDTFNFAVSGIGGANHLAGIDFAQRAGIKWTYVPYKGGSQALTDMVGGQSNVMFNGMLATYPFVKDGKLKVLAVSSAKRFSAAPEIPTVAESGMPGFETGSWQGIVAPAGTPPEVVNRLHATITSILSTSDMKDRLDKAGAEVRPMSPAQFGGPSCRLWTGST